VNEWLNTSMEGGQRMIIASKSSQRRVSKGEKLRAKPSGNLQAVRPCHRLDFDTSGVVVVALTPESHRKTSLLFEHRNITKTYIALVAGHVQQDNGVISFPVGKVQSKIGDYHEFACYTGNNGLDLSDFIQGSLREAETEFVVANRFTLPTSHGKASAKYTRIILKPVTGRGHQLRLHCAAIGHEILGDTLHGKSAEISRCTPRLCLHAEEICMTANVRNKATMIKITSIAPF
jgi:tRNA pseudouridine32 synthase/23S rRNA pseudouridine746 synthase